MHISVCQMFMLQQYSQAIETLISLTTLIEKCLSYDFESLFIILISNASSVIAQLCGRWGNSDI